jgi:hypothetical protein
MESDVKEIINERIGARLAFTTPWMIGPAVYVTGLILSLVTGNLTSFLSDYPWICLLTVVTVAIWAVPLLAQRHGLITIKIRPVFNVSDQEFKTLLVSNLRRLTGLKNILLGLIFLPGLLWAFTQRLWWSNYSQPLIFDVYYLIILVFILLFYASTMFGAAISCNQNVYMMCEKTKVNVEYLIDEGQPLLRRLWGGQIMRITALTLIMSALTNVPIMLYSGSTSIMINLAIALTLTAFIFVVPHVMFHRMLERAKEEELARVSERRRGLRLDLNDGNGVAQQDSVGKMLDLIYLTQYEGMLSTRNTWLVDLEVVIELLVVGSLHVTFMEALNVLMHR